MPLMTAREPRSRGVALALGFLAGAVAVLTFHQGAIALLTATGVIHGNLYSVRPVPPFGVPQIVSSAFWGGVWGSVFAAIAPRALRGMRYWLAGLALGAVALPLVGGFVVAPLKGQPLAAGGDAGRMAISMLVNGAWGIGVAILYRTLRRRPMDA
ncbi:MAG: hypothetical protein ABIX11_12420 [Casimicrobiaceae bacterium]